VHPDEGDVTREHVARGATLATLSRLGAVIEVIAQPIYTWAFGIATYGVYTVLWGAVNIIENIVDLSMTTALQRVIPTERDAAAQHSALKFAILVAMTPAILIAALVTIFATPIAGLISAAPEDRATLPMAVALFAWALPLWTFVEVATSAARAKRAFGPEIRLRIFWEQVARLVFAVSLYAIGFHRLGLMIGHLLSLTLTALLSIRLLARYYDLRMLLTVPVDRRVARALMATGMSTLPGAIASRLFVDLPGIILNVLLPGAQGATATGLYAIARKIASIPMIVRQAFQYVLAPLSAAQAARDRALIGPLYRFASRVSIALVIPIAGFLILLAPDILSFFAPEARAAVSLIVILVAGRALEALVGPAQTVVEMTGHRGLPVLNSAIGFAAWATIVWLLVRGEGAMGMAIAVSVAIVVISWLAAAELAIADRITAFDRRFATGLAVALTGLGVMWALGELVDPIGARLRAGLIILLFPAVVWLSLRFGLAGGDRKALGRVGRKLRLSA